MPEVGENGWDKDMTTYEDVRSFDVANFDKPVPDIMDAAETVVRETEIAGQAIAAKKKIKNSRKKQTDNKDKPLPLYGNDLFTPNNIKDNEQGNQERIKAWEEKHGKRIEDLNAEETVEACMEVMCLTRSEAEEYLSATRQAACCKESKQFQLPGERY